MEHPSPQPHESSEHIAAQRAFVAERMATLALLAAAVFASAWWERTGHVSGHFMLFLPLAALVLVRLSSPLWSRLFVRPSLRRPLGSEYVYGGIEAMLALLAGAAMADGSVWAVVPAALLMLMAYPPTAGARKLAAADANLLPPIDDLLARARFPRQSLRVWNGLSELPAILVPCLHRQMIVLAASSLTAYTPGELRLVIAHELGHYARRDLQRAAALRWGLKMLQAGALVTVLVAAADPGRAVGAGALAFFLAETLSVPVLMWSSRRHEYGANQWALAATGDAEAFSATYRKLHHLAGDPPEPTAWERFWFGTHMSLQQVLRQANAASRKAVKGSPTTEEQRAQK